jgi:hypothetical protein
LKAGNSPQGEWTGEESGRRDQQTYLSVLKYEKAANGRFLFVWNRINPRLLRDCVVSAVLESLCIAYTFRFSARRFLALASKPTGFRGSKVPSARVAK